MDWSEGGSGNYLRGCSVTTLFFHETRWSRTLPGKTGRRQANINMWRRSGFKKLPLPQRLHMQLICDSDLCSLSELFHTFRPSYHSEKSQGGGPGQRRVT